MATREEREEIRAFYREYDRLKSWWIMIPYTRIGSQSACSLNEPTIVKFNEDLIRGVNHLLPFQQARHDAVHEADFPTEVLKMVQHLEESPEMRIHKLQIKMDHRRQALQFNVGNRRLRRMYPLGAAWHDATR